MKNFLALVVLIFSAGSLTAQTASVTEKIIELKTYPFSEPDPVPEFETIFPYFQFDGYEATGELRKWKMIEMENDYIKLWVAPEIGGKIWGAIEKSTGKEFVYFNHVVKFRNVAKRGPWTSGGIEINFGIIGHAPTASTPVDYLLRNNSDGSVSCFLSAIDLASRTRWAIEINLPAGKAYFTTRATWDNPTALEQSYYHWMNMGIKVKGNLEYIFPGNKHIGHDGNAHTWPADTAARKINFYENNNFGGPKSYHVLGEATGFFGTYWHDDDFGFGHYSTYDDKPGKKIWIWGLSDQGMIWENLLTDTDGQYSEIQSGRTFNQANQESSYSPFKNRGFAPGSSDEWTEYWFPVKETKGLKYALPAGSVNMEQKDDMVTLWFCPNEISSGLLEVKKNTEVLFSREINCIPMKIIKASFQYTGDYRDLTVSLNNNLVFDANHEKYLLKRPSGSPPDFDWTTAYGHYLKGSEFEHQRLYTKAMSEYEKAVEKEKWFIPALTGLARMCYRKTDYQAAMDLSLKALSVNTYDAGANMMYGLSGLALEDTVSAIDGFSIASQDITFRSPACNLLANIYIRKGDFEKALNYAEKSQSVNSLSSEAVQLKILCLRKLGKINNVDVELANLEENDPLNHFIWFEKYILDPSPENKINAKKLISNELPQETYLEYALWYFRNRQISDALKILNLAPGTYPVVEIWKSYLTHLSGDDESAGNILADALKVNPQFAFPFRKETFDPLNWAEKLSDNWKIEYYKGLIFLGTGASDKGMELWENIGQAADFWPFYVARSALRDTNRRLVQSDIDKAMELGGNDWRVGMAAIRNYLKQGQYKEAEKTAEIYYNLFPGNFNVGLQYAKSLEMNKNYFPCLTILKKIQMLPGEGASESRVIWRNANLGYAQTLMDAGKHRKALEYIGYAREWPENLGVGRPYTPDESKEDAMALECYEKLNDKKSIKMMNEKLKNIQ